MLRNFAQKTIDAYTYHVGKFAEFLGKSPLEATPEDVRSFQLHMIEVKNKERGRDSNKETKKGDATQF